MYRIVVESFIFECIVKLVQRNALKYLERVDS